MASVPDTSHLPWWLGPSKAPWEAMIEGIQAGSTVRANQIRTQQVIAENEQNLQRAETNTQLKLMDLSLEKDRNDLSKQAFQVRQDSALTQARGMTEIGNYLGQATKDDKLTDPETQAGFWNLTSKYAPFINEQTVNSMWDNTFKAAMDRKDRSTRVGGQPTLIQYDKYIKDLEDQASQIENLYPDDQEQLDEAQRLRDSAEGMKVASRLLPPGSGPKSTGVMSIDDGKGGTVTVPYFVDAKGNLKSVKPPKEGLSDLHKMQYANELRSLEFKLEKDAFDPSEKLDPKEPASVTYNRQFKELAKKYEPLAGTTTKKPVDQSTPSFDDFLKWKGQ